MDLPSDLDPWLTLAVLVRPALLVSTWGCGADPQLSRSLPCPAITFGSSSVGKQLGLSAPQHNSMTVSHAAAYYPV